MALSKKFQAQNSELTAEDIHQALEAQFPDYKVSLNKALFGAYVQVDKSLFTGVAVVLRGKGNVFVNPQNGSFWVRFLLGWLIAYFTSTKLVDEVGGYLEQTFG